MNIETVNKNDGMRSLIEQRIIDLFADGDETDYYAAIDGIVEFDPDVKIEENCYRWSNEEMLEVYDFFFGNGDGL